MPSISRRALRPRRHRDRQRDARLAPRTRLRVSVDLAGAGGRGQDRASARDGRQRLRSRLTALTPRSEPARGTARPRSSGRGRSATGTTSLALAQSVFASRPNSCARKSSRRPTGPPSASSSRAAADMGAQPVELLADVGLGGDQHRLLMQARRIEARAAVEQRRRSAPRAGRGSASGCRAGCASASSTSRAIVSSCWPRIAGERPSLLQPRRLTRLDQRADRRRQRPAASASSCLGIGRIVVDLDDAADGEQAVERRPAHVRRGSLRRASASTGALQHLLVDAQPAERRLPRVSGQVELARAARSSALQDPLRAPPRRGVEARRACARGRRARVR